MDDNKRAPEVATNTVPHGIPIVEATTTPPDAELSELLIITGMSGAGRSHAAGVLEDLNYYVVDNLPPRMLIPLIDMTMHSGGAVNRVAAVVDVRSREFFTDLTDVLQQMDARQLRKRIIFLEASDEELVQRYKSVRRPHPLQKDGLLTDGIAEERLLIAGVRSIADVVIDTTSLNVHDLARAVREQVSHASDEPLKINVVSFGFKYGVPIDADHIADMRFLKNPYWITELRHLTGRDAPVSEYVLSQPGAMEFIENYVKALKPVLAGYQNEEKRYTTIAIGCTGGKHRSVATTIELANRLRQLGYPVQVSARDLGKE